jgi:formate hydrogenlyase transcriptional activator
VDVRVIAATNRDLEEMVREGKFRADLYYRLNVVPLRVPALRERASDIPLLVMFFTQRFAKKMGKQITRISDEAMRRLTGYTWPGNIRELQNVIERAVILSSGKMLVLAEELRAPATPLLSRRVSEPSNSTPSEKSALIQTPAARDGAPAADVSVVGGSLDDVERRHIEAVLNQTNWMIEGEEGAARILDLKPSTLRSRMQKLGIKRPAR